MMSGGCGLRFEKVGRAMTCKARLRFDPLLGDRDLVYQVLDEPCSNANLVELGATSFCSLPGVDNQRECHKADKNDAETGEQQHKSDFCKRVKENSHWS